MMSEGHDRIGSVYRDPLGRIYNNEAEALDAGRKWMAAHEQHNVNRTPENYGIRAIQGGDKFMWEYYQTQPEQSAGMRLHYDRTLPKIAEELTGSKGERVGFGEHEKAMEKGSQQWNDARVMEGALAQGLTEEQARAYVEQTRANRHGIPRKDLIFRNSDGTPKTDITARAYPLDKTLARLDQGEPFSLMQKYHAGPSLSKEALDKIRKLLHPSIFYPVDTLPSKPIERPAGVKSDLEASMEKAVSQPIESYERLRRQPGEKKLTLESVRNNIANALNKARKLDKMLLPVDVIFDMLDGGMGKYDGWTTKNIRNPINEAYQQELNLRTALIDPITKMQKDMKLSDEQAERIGVYAHMQQKGGYNHLRDSGVADETISKIMNSITKDEVKMYQAMRSVLDETLPAVQSVMKELYGQNVKVVPNYFPMPRDWERYDSQPPSIAKGTFDEHGTWKMLELDYEPRGSSVEKGFTKTRVKGAKGAIKVNAFEIYQQHMQDVAHLLALQKTLHKIGQTVRGDLFRDKYGDMGQDLVLDWLNTVARQGRTGKRFVWLDTIRNNTSKGIVGFRIASQLVHTANIPLAMQRVGVNNWRIGVQDAMFDERAQTLLHEHFQETFERGGGEPALQDAIKNKTEWAFAIQRGIDRLNAQATTLAAYRSILMKKGVKDYLNAPYDAEAGNLALTFARRAVASPLYKDIPLALSRGGSWGKMFFQFQNTFLDQWSNIRYDLASAGVKQSTYAFLAKNFGTSASQAALASKVALAVAAMIVAESGIKFGVKQGLNAATGNPVEGGDEYFKKLFEDAVKRIPGMGQAMNMTLYGESGMPSVDVAVGVAKGAIRTAKDLSSDTATEAQKLEAVRGLVTSAAELAGVPASSQVGEIARLSIKDKALADKAKAKNMTPEQYKKWHEDNVEKAKQRKEKKGKRYSVIVP
jgi:hypothetical protein